MARRSDTIRPILHAERRLTRNQHAVAFARDRLAQDLFRHSFRVHVGRIEEIHAGVEADVHEPRRFRYVRAAPRLEKFIAATKCPGAKGKNRNQQTGPAKLSIFHGAIDTLLVWRYAAKDPSIVSQMRIVSMLI